MKKSFKKVTKLTAIAAAALITGNASAATLLINVGSSSFDYTGTYAAPQIPGGIFTDNFTTGGAVGPDGVIDIWDGYTGTAFSVPSGSTITLPTTLGYTIGDEFGANPSDGNDLTALFDTMSFALTNDMAGKLTGDPDGAGGPGVAGIYSADIQLLKNNGVQLNTLAENEGIGDTPSDNALTISYDIPAMTFDITFNDADFTSAYSVASGAILGVSNADLKIDLEVTDMIDDFWFTSSLVDFGTSISATNPYLLTLLSTGNVNSASVDVFEPEDIPAPTVLALMGLGLFGLGIAKRRKEKKFA